MPYIKKVRIQGFQSHLDSTFTLSPGLNVITGPSDAGKTAIIRALRWLAFNEPQGEAFIHTIRDTDGNITQSAEQATLSKNYSYHKKIIEKGIYSSIIVTKFMITFIKNLSDTQITVIIVIAGYFLTNFKGGDLFVSNKC